MAEQTKIKPPETQIDPVLAAEFARMNAEEGIELIRMAREKREKEKREIEAARTGADKVLVYSTYHNYHLARTPGLKTPTVMHDGKVQYLDDKTHPHRHYEFDRFRCWIAKADLPFMRSQEGYGSEFIEAIAVHDGDPLAVSLEQWMDSARGEAFLLTMIDHAKRQRTVLTRLEIVSELKALRAGKLTAPAPAHVKPKLNDGIVRVA